jgi:hypothetical protein
MHEGGLNMDAIEFLMYFFILLSGTLGVILIGGLAWFARQLGKGSFLFFDTPSTCRIVNKKVVGGRVSIDNESFQVAGQGINVKPKQLKTRFGWRPIWRLDSGSITPTPFDKAEYSKDNPQTLKVVGELKTLDAIANPSKPPLWIFIMLIGAGIAIGVMALFVLVATGAVAISPPATSAPPVILPPTPTQV